MLRIDKVDGQLGIRTTNAKLQMEQPPPDFKIEQKPATLEIHTEQAKIQIDQQQCRNESGLMDTLTLTEDAAQRGKQAVLEGIARIVDEGNSMAAIHTKANAIVEIALSNSISNIDFNIGTMPKSRPKFDVVGGTVDIKVNEGYVDVVSKPNKPIIEVIPGNVEVYLLRKPEINIRYIGKNIDEKI